MRPTPSETLTGIATILRTTVAPAVTDAHAREQLHQVITVLGQLRVDDRAAEQHDRDVALRGLMARCREWVDAEPGRAVGFTGPLAVEAADASIEAASEARLTNRGRLEEFIVELRAWRLRHGTIDSGELVAAITDHLAGAAGTTT